jgi:hypothetical protein
MGGWRNGQNDVLWFNVNSGSMKCGTMSNNNVKKEKRGKPNFCIQVTQFAFDRHIE